MTSQKSDDWPHIAVKTQCNNTPNGSLQFTLVPLQDWAVFIIPSSYNVRISPLSNNIPVTSEDRCNVPSCFHMALLDIYSCQYHCDVVWTDTTDLLNCYILLLMPSRNFSFIRIAVLPIHYAVCQPLQLSPCQEVHPQAVITLPLGQPANIELLSPTRQGPLNLVSSMELTHPHNSGFNFMCSGSWSNPSDAPTLSRNAPCSATLSNCILNACKSHHKQMFQLMWQTSSHIDFCTRDNTLMLLP